jgi:predicted P-loop ATPase
MTPGDAFGEYHMLTMRVWLEGELQREPPVTVIRKVLRLLSAQREVHPVRDYLGRLRWDGIRRIGEAGVPSWLTTYLGAEDTARNTFLGDSFLRSAIRTLDDPGSQAGIRMILHGPSGCGKSRTLEALAGPFFSENPSGPEGAVGIWIHELPLDGGNVAAMRKLAYTRFATRSGFAMPLQCVWVGTTCQRPRQDLRDVTVSVGEKRADIEGLQRVRDQLWAEAMMRYRCSNLVWF